MHPAAPATPNAALPPAFLQYLEGLSRDEPEAGRAERIAWRYSCFHQGLRYADYVESHFFPLRGRQVLDAACAWGGHALAFASRGARVVAADLNDHRFDRLAEFARQCHVELQTVQANCEQLPLGDQVADVVLGLELVEHIASVPRFARQVGRVLRPGGVLLLSTPARWRSFFWGEPHYGIKGLTLLPLAWQRLVATRLFRRAYPYPIPRQYNRARQVIQPFAELGLSGFPVMQGRLAERLRNHPRLSALARERLWSFIVLERRQA